MPLLPRFQIGRPGEVEDLGPPLSAPPDDGRPPDSTGGRPGCLQTPARHARDAFGGLLALGVTLWITWQGWIQLGGLTGLIPFSGIPFPFISYGGSALLSELMGGGDVAQRRQEARG